MKNKSFNIHDISHFLVSSIQSWLVFLFGSYFKWFRFSFIFGVKHYNSVWHSAVCSDFLTKLKYNNSMWMVWNNMFAEHNLGHYSIKIL